MDQQELDEWRDFCEGSKYYAPEHFSKLFMEMFLEPSSEQDQGDLRRVFSFVGNSSRTLEKMLRLGGRAIDKSDQEIFALVTEDLREMRHIISDQEILSSIDRGVTEIVVDEFRFDQIFEASLNVRFINSLSDYVIEEMFRDNNRMIEALSHAFYGLASDLHLKYALTADLLKLDVSFENYFELFLIGVDYALHDKGVLVMNYRKARSGS